MIGRVVATELKPSTPHQFHFWTATDTPIGIGAIVKVMDVGPQPDKVVYGVVTEGFYFPQHGNEAVQRVIRSLQTTDAARDARVQAIGDRAEEPAPSGRFERAVLYREAIAAELDVAPVTSKTERDLVQDNVNTVGQIFAVVGLAWLNAAVVPLAPAPVALPLERALVVGVAAVTLLLGAFAAWIQDDIKHIVAYSIVQDAAFVILAFAALDSASWAPALTWILVFVLAKSAFAAWALAVRRRFGTRKLRELRGWARRTPLLTGALVIIAAATIGWPGVASYEARMALIRLTSDGPFRWVLTLGAICALAYYARVLAVGLALPGAAVRAAEDDRPRWPLVAVLDSDVIVERVAGGAEARSAGPSSGPRAQPRRPKVPEGSVAGGGHRGREVWLERTRQWFLVARSSTAPVVASIATSSRQVGARAFKVARSSTRLIVPAIELNQAFVAAALVLALSVMALVGALGGWSPGPLTVDGSRLGSVAAAR